MPAAEAPRQVAGAREAQIPRATYRLQLNAGFTFADATALVPYLAALGVSHLYCSPYFRARAGSTHGYDVVDHNAFNPEIGERRGLRAPGGHAARPRHGPHRRHRAEPRRHPRRRQRLVDGRARERPGLGVRRLLRHRLGPRQPRPRATRCWCRCWRTRTARCSSAASWSCASSPPAGSFAVFYHEHRLPLDPRSYPRILDRVSALRRQHRAREHPPAVRRAARPAHGQPRAGGRAPPRQGAAQAAPRAARRRHPGRGCGDRCGGAQLHRHGRGAGQLRCPARAARAAGLPPRLLARRRRRHQLPPLLRRQ